MVVFALTVLFVPGWIKKRKRHLLMFAGVMSVLWIVFFYYFNYRTLSVSEKNLQHEFQTNAWDTVHLHHLYRDKKQTNVMSDSLSLMQDKYNISNHVKGNSRADISQSNSLLYSVKSPAPEITHNDSHIRAIKIDKDDIRQRQNSSFYDVDAAVNLLPGWLRYDPSLQLLFNRKNMTRSTLKHKLLEEMRPTAKLVRTPLKPVREPLLASGHKPSGIFEFDIQHAVDRYKRIVLSVVDSGYVNFAINFQRLSVDTIGLQNFLFVCIDQQAVVLLQQHGIACSYYRKSTTIQVTAVVLWFQVLYKRGMMTPETVTFAVKSLYDSFSGLTLAD